MMNTLNISDAFNMIKSSKVIARYMGYDDAHWRRSILPYMVKYNCVFKLNGKKNSAWITSPYFINLYYFLKELDKRTQ